uniref:non-specific serine/threonine protein kinase n=1 Tax=viral metagenome TaxID=1070528 RepID=A0A6C0HT22_9ZZZZ
MNSTYKLLEEIGSGQFGIVYKGLNTKTQEEVAIKIECKQKTKLLKREANIYLLLAKEDGFPRLKWYGSTDTVYYMVFDLLGLSLADLKKRSDEIPLIIVKRLAKKMVRLVEKVHNYQLLHRDIKPDNFLFDKEDYDKIYLIDFGLAKSYMNTSNVHVKEDVISNCIGTQEFVSLNVHNRKLPSRKDDLESVVYILYYLILPQKKWIKSEDEEDIKLFKQSLNEKILSKILEYVRSLSYFDTPNYNELIELIETI